MARKGELTTLETVNEKIRNIHPHLTVIEYSGSKSACTVVGDCGHTWSAMDGSILGKKGGFICRVCTPRKPNITSKTITLEEANNKLHAKYPDIGFVTYSGSTNLSEIFRKDCGHSWLGKPKDVLSGHSAYICRVCNPASNSKLTLEQANNRLLTLFPDLEFINYLGLQIPSEIKSKICGHTWTTTLNNITTGNTPAICPLCNPRVSGTSKPEKDLLEYIKQIYSGWIVENDRSCISPYELDIVLPELGIAIEYNGIYWHSDENTKLTLVQKSNLLKNSMEYRLIHVNEDEWRNKQDIVKSRISAILKLPMPKIFARNCVVKEITFPSAFLAINHLQGIGSATSTNLGLFLNDKLISVMTFSKSRFNKEYDYELVRYCSMLNTYVVGGASKLFKYFINKYPNCSIISYSDKRWSDGELYKKLGFSYLHTSSPNYRYYKSSHSLSRYQCQKHLLKDLFPEIPDQDNKTELEIMTEAKYYKLSDCGNDVWVLNYKSM